MDKTLFGSNRLTWAYSYHMRIQRIVKTGDFFFNRITSKLVQMLKWRRCDSLKRTKNILKTRKWQFRKYFDPDDPPKIPQPFPRRHPYVLGDFLAPPSDRTWQPCPASPDPSSSASSLCSRIRDYDLYDGILLRGEKETHHYEGWVGVYGVGVGVFETKLGVHFWVVFG